MARGIVQDPREGTEGASEQPRQATIAENAINQPRAAGFYFQTPARDVPSEGHAVKTYDEWMDRACFSLTIMMVAVGVTTLMDLEERHVAAWGLLAYVGSYYGIAWVRSLRAYACKRRAASNQQEQEKPHGD